MRISEAAEMTGLSVSNIRFYEKKGLLAPEREMENKYRDYSDEDIHRLKKIVLFRKMDIPIETIYLLEKGDTSLESVLKRQEEELLARQKMLQGSIDLCQQLMKEENPDKINVEYYLNYVKEEEAKGYLFAEAEEVLEDLVEFTGIGKFRGDPFVGRIFQNVWVLRGIALLIFACAILVPLYLMKSAFDASGEISPFAGLWWLLWMLGLGGSWNLFKKNRR